MTYSEAQNKASQKYKKANWKRVPFDVPNEFYDLIKQAAEQSGEKVNSYIKKAIEQRMEREGVAVGDTRPGE